MCRLKTHTLSVVIVFDSRDRSHEVRTLVFSSRIRKEKKKTESVMNFFLIIYYFHNGRVLRLDRARQVSLGVCILVADIIFLSRWFRRAANREFFSSYPRARTGVFSQMDLSCKTVPITSLPPLDSRVYCIYIYICLPYIIVCTFLCISRV